MVEIAEWSSNLIFLARCLALEMIPRDSRVECRVRKCTRHIVRILNECSYRLILHYQDYSRLRKEKLRRSLLDLHEKLENILSMRDLNRVGDLAEVKYAKLFDYDMEFKSGVLGDLPEEYGFQQN
ncbi:hypothetical protein HPB48_009884 [Haemaphysalis longicornis]|uniref:Uncharacterized protein n=1 Tax=Haemaphysalis longicornis TaxID=44386 RepID=A0A9J6GBN1_HAELO|nr:hypothetical protein HPB48_009884 [Haemaphysalis longicornis]